MSRSPGVPFGDLLSRAGPAAESAPALPGRAARGRENMSHRVAGARFRYRRGLFSPGRNDVALGSTVYTFQITLNDADRGVYEALEFRVARHPSETEEFLLARTLAYCLEYGEGLAFSSGLSDPDAPALAVRDLTGALQSWIEICLPEPARLHKATKAAKRVVVYSHKEVATLLARVAAERVHRAADIEVYEFDRDFLEQLRSRLARRMRFDLAVTDRQLYLSIGADTLIGSVTLHHPDLSA